MKNFLFLIAILFVSIEIHAARPIRGIYQVPTTSDLAAYSQYPVKFKSEAYEGITSKIDFPLPQDLTGVPQTITITKNNDGSWSGPQTEGNCQVIDRHFQCTMKFHNLVFDETQATKFIQEKYSPSEVQGRMEVFRRFSGEPIGILKYKLRGRDQAR